MSSYPFPVAFRRAAFVDERAGVPHNRHPAAAGGALASLPLRLFLRTGPASEGFRRTARRPALPGRLWPREIAV